MTQSRKTIAVDFDGVIHQYDRGWQGGEIYGDALPGAIENLEKLLKDFNLYILTTRATDETWYGTKSLTGADAIRCWLREHGASPALQEIHIGLTKHAAIAYIDDRAVRFTNWPDVRKMFQ